MRSPVVCTMMGFAGGDEGAYTAEPRGVSEASECSLLLSER